MGRVKSQAFTFSSSQRGNIHCAWDSHLYQTFDWSLSSVAPPPLCRLDKTIQHRAYLGDADRPCQKQVRTSCRKRAPVPATDHPPATGETTCLYQNGPNAPGAPGGGSDLATSPVRCPARGASAVVSPGFSALLEI